MLITDNLIFLHIPRTGGNWVYEAIEASIRNQKNITFTKGHQGCKAIQNIRQDKLVLTFVRHPVTWYASYWNRRVSLGWTAADIDQFKSDNLDTFVNRAIDKHRNYCEGLYKRYTCEATVVGKYEHLVDDLIAALKQSNTDFDEDVIRSYPPVNCSNFQRHSGQMTEATARRIINNEKHIIDTYEYGTDITNLKLVFNTNVENGILQDPKKCT